MMLLTTTFPVGAARNKALAIYGAIGASGFLMGVVAGGLLTELDWRLVFIAPAILALGFFVTGLITLPSDLEGRSTGRGRFDLTGGVLLTGTLVSVVMGVVSVGDEIGSPVGWSALVIAVLLFAAFTVHQQRSANPLIPVGLLFSGLSQAASSVPAFNSAQPSACPLRDHCSRWERALGAGPGRLQARTDRALRRRILHR
ncbi:hypothetical protein CH289_10855 [Rhodococcus sp. RS1C4]|nr:hypothetical protein CH289_10855 [Rhodococcus sp. RS1C4]